MATRETAIDFYNIYLKKIGHQKAFQVWLSKKIKAPKGSAVKFTVQERVNHYFITLFKAIGGVI